MEHSTEVFQKIKNEFVIIPSNAISGYLPKEQQIYKFKGNFIHCGAIYNNQTMETI